MTTEPRQEAERLLDELVTLRELATSEVDYGVPPSEQDADYKRWRDRLATALAAVIEWDQAQREYLRLYREDVATDDVLEAALRSAKAHVLASEALSALREDET